MPYESEVCFHMLHECYDTLNEYVPSTHLKASVYHILL